jgi:predicted HTH transcriptional regulator
LLSLRIRDACEQNGNRVIFSFSDSFWVEIESNNQADAPEYVTDNVTDRQNTILLMIAENKFISAREIAEKLNFSKRTILREIDDMKTMGLMKRIGKEKGGHWEIRKDEVFKKQAITDVQYDPLENNLNPFTRH